jgi:geranylgeranyl transferase type-2 subunit beta
MPPERRTEFITFIKACQHKNGGFGGNLGHDPHVTTSLYALLILAMFDATNEIDLDLAAQYFAKL